MKILENQKVYQCEYCGKRLLSKAGAKLHESTYCKNEQSPAQKAVRFKQKQCEHKNIETVWTYLEGDSMPVPDYEICTDCNKRDL